MIKTLKDYGIFKVISALLIGQPMDRTYESEYIQILKDVIDDESLPIVTNINVGHSLPRCIIPFGVMSHIDVDKQVIEFEY